MTRVRASRPFEEYHEEQMQDPEFAAAYRALEPEFQVAREVIRLRLERSVGVSKFHFPQPGVVRCLVSRARMVYNWAE